MAKAYLDKIEKYADQAPGTMPFDLARKSFREFSLSIVLAPELPRS